MYKAYMLDENEILELVSDYSDEAIYSPIVDVKQLKNNLRKMLFHAHSTNAALKASDLWDSFFPNIDIPVFLSHSSQDKTIVRKLANYLFINFGIVSFIDSDLWGCIQDLQVAIDKKFCLQPGKQYTYDYADRNYSTAHTHMILSYALTRMINQSECFIFLKSDNSIAINDSIKGTFSPWIFHELITVDTIEITRPGRINDKVAESIESSLKQLSEQRLKVHYPIPCRRLLHLSPKILTKLEEIKKTDNTQYEDWEFYLNSLYNIAIKSNRKFYET